MKSTDLHENHYALRSIRIAFAAIAVWIAGTMAVSTVAAQNGGGSLKVTSFPSGAKVVIDAIDTGKVTPMSVSLPVGNHSVVVSVPGSGWNSVSRTVTVVSGENELSVTLTPAGAGGIPGPKGDKGDKGDTGPQGPAGPAGNGSGGGLRGTQEFTTSSSFVVPAGVSNLFVELWGGGGGGQGGSVPGSTCTIFTVDTGNGISQFASCPPPGASGQGGGSGAYVRSVVPVTPGETLYIAIGQGGAGSGGATSPAGPASGASGGDTEIRQGSNSGPILVSAAGGAGGDGLRYPTGAPGGTANALAMIVRAGKSGGLGNSYDSPGTGGLTAVSGPLPGFGAGSGGKGGTGSQIGINFQTGSAIYTAGSPGTAGLPGYALIVW